MTSWGHWRERLVWLNVGLRGLMEAAIVAGLAYWGFSTGDGMVAKTVLAIGTAVVGFGIWGAIDFRQSGPWAEVLRLIEELVISGLAALAWAMAGRPAIGLVLAILSIAHHGLVYATGRRLLKR
jgi:hypothetical protein